MTNIISVKATGQQKHYAILENGTEIEISRCEYFRLLIGLVLVVAGVGEHHSNGTEAERSRIAENLAEVRRVAA